MVARNKLLAKEKIF